MRWLASALLLALLAATVALIVQINAGNVAFYVAPYRVDVSLNLFIVGLLLVLAIVYWIARAVQKMVDFPEQVKLYRARREEVGGHQALLESVRSLLEGRFARAEKAARAAQSSPTAAGVAALVGARAAHRMQEYERRDEWLDKAGDAPDLETARLVSSAEMWTEQRANEAALDAIHRLHGAGARHIHAMRIALNANVQSGRWDEALKTIRALEKRNALHPVLARKMKRTAYREQLALHRHEPAALVEGWRELPEADRKLPDVALDAARLLNRAGRGQLAAQAIEQALAAAPDQWDETAEPLIDEYARAQAFPARDQLARVESWLGEVRRGGPLRASLLRTAGLICLREQLWGKAKGYLTDSLAEARQPATLLALGQLSEAIGDNADAFGFFREAALGYANLPPTEPPAVTLRGAAPDIS
jgi:HemY protein